MSPHLEEVFQLYEVPEDQRAEIIRYAAQPNIPEWPMASLLAVPEMEKVSGKARRRLDLVRFWDSEDDEELFGRVLLKGYPKIPLNCWTNFLRRGCPGFQEILTQS
jgi:hypothetical protein